MKQSKDTRRLRKKIRQIEHLEGSRRTLTHEEKVKVQQKEELRQKLAKALSLIPNNSEAWPEDDEIGNKRARSKTHEAVHAPLQPPSKQQKAKEPKEPKKEPPKPTIRLQERNFQLSLSN